jgi:type I restriction enzyme S subunit
VSFPPYGNYRDTDTLQLKCLPSHWVEVPLKWLGSIKYGIGEPPSYQEEGTRLIRATNVDHGRVVEAGMVYVDPADIPEKRILWLQVGDIIVVRSGAYTGDSAIIRSELLPAIAGFDMVVRPANCVAQFLQYALLSQYLREGQIDQVKLRAAQPHLNAEELGTCMVAVPPIEEQLVIAAFLDRETAKIDALVEAQQRLIELLKEKRQAVISHAVTKGLDPNAPMKDSGVEWLGEVPAHWDLSRLKFEGEIIIGLTYGPNDVADNQEGTLVLRSSNVQNGSLALDDNVFVSCPIPERLQTQTGDILICSRNGSRALIGKNAQITSDVAGQSFGAFMTVLRSSKNSFLFWVLNSQIFQFQSARFLTSTINQLTVGDLGGFEIAVPPPQEWQEVAEFLEREVGAISRLIEQAQYSIVLLRERRVALIAAAVTGKIDVRGLASEPAEAEAA